MRGGRERDKKSERMGGLGVKESGQGPGGKGGVWDSGQGPG